MPVDTPETKLAEARQRVTTQLQGMVSLFGPLEAAGTYLAPAVAILEASLGRDKAAEYLRQLADGLETEPDTLQGRA